MLFHASLRDAVERPPFRGLEPTATFTVSLRDRGNALLARTNPFVFATKYIEVRRTESLMNMQTLTIRTFVHYA